MAHGTAQRMSGFNHLIVNIARQGTTSARPICIIMEKLPTYRFLMQGPMSCLPFNATRTSVLRSAIHRQGPMSCSISISFYYQGPMSCSISYSSRLLPGFVICDISVSGPATELIPSPSDSKLLFAIVPIYLLDLL